MTHRQVVSADGVPGTQSDSGRYRGPPPRPPDDGEAWYAPKVLAQRTVHPGVVTTVREQRGRSERHGRDPGGELRYETREPELSVAGERALESNVADLAVDSDSHRQSPFRNRNRKTPIGGF